MDHLTSPLFGALALQDRTDQVIDFVSKRDPLLARQMNAELANNAPSELSDRSRCDDQQYLQALRHKGSPLIARIDQQSSENIPQSS